MDTIIRIIDGEAWRKLTPEEAFQILGKKSEVSVPKKKGRVMNAAARAAQSKKMKAYWKEKKAAAKKP